DGLAVALFDHDQHLADCADLPLGHHDLRDAAGLGRRDLDGRLVSHDLDHRLIHLDHVALGDLPLHHFPLDDAFSDVRELELEGHGYPSSVRVSAPTMRSAFGRYSCSSVYGNGVSKPQTRSIGASRCSIARSQIEATSSAPKPQVRGASCAITQRPVFFTDAR